MPFTFDADGTLATQSDGEWGRRRPTDENLAELEEGGGEQTVRLLGPFTIAHDAAGLQATGGPAGTFAEGASVGVVALPVGARVILPWAELADQFPTVTNPEVKLYVQPEDDPDNHFQIGQSGNGEADENFQIAYPGWTDHAIATVLTSGCELAVVLNYVGDPPTAGEAVIYVLIAEPSA